MSKRTIQLEVLRYRPEQDKEPFFQTYTVPCEEEWVVLDALNYVKDEIDRTLSYRWSCHMFVCGSCGYKIDGEPKLGCKAFLRDYKDKIRGRAARQLSDRARPRRHRRLHREAGERQAYLIPKKRSR